MKVKEICHSITDGSHNPPQGIEESEYLMLSSKNIFDDEITVDDPRFLTEEDFQQEDKRTRIVPGDVLLTIVGTVGRTAVVPNNMPQFTLQRSVAVLHPQKDVCLSRFLMYALRSKRTYIEKTAKGVAQKGIYLGEVGEIDVPIPTIEQQVSVVAILDKVDLIIKRRQMQLRTLDTLIKARFVEMFGDPETNPKGWEKKPLSEVIITANNGMARRGNDEDGNIVMRLVELQDGYIDYSNPNRIVLTDAEKKRYLLKDKDFLFARVNGNPENVGRCAVFFNICEPVFHNDHIIRVHFDDNALDGQFASALLNSEYGKRQLKNQIKTSAGQYTVSQDGIGAIVAILPPLEFQLLFAAFVAQVNKSKFAVQKSLEETQKLFDSLMQQYFG